MQPAIEVIERTQTPRGELQLQRRGNHFEIISNGTFLMATYNGESERLLVSAALDAVPQAKHVVIGGLGVGFSLAEALRYQSVQEVSVVEIEEKVIDWNRTHLAPFSSYGLDDSRTRMIQANLLEWISQEKGTYDAICLDIDNGPDWTVTDANSNLYQKDNLIRLAHLLSPYGVVAFWSASHSEEFERMLTDIFVQVKRKTIPREKGEDDCVYVASVAKA